MVVARRGHGSLAPWNPPTELVLAGPYRYCRNPMITGIFAMLLGEVIALWSPWMGGWFALFVLAQYIYVRVDEEPLLRKRFGEAYRVYCENVPRWLPRWTPFALPPDRTRVQAPDARR